MRIKDLITLVLRNLTRTRFRAALAIPTAVADSGDPALWQAILRFLGLGS
jgi:hypothetical protein